MAVRTRREGGRARPSPEWLSVEAPEWARIRLHRGDPAAAHLTVIEPAALSVRSVQQLCAALTDQGVRRIVTNALDPTEAAPLTESGFEVGERLDLLGRPLTRLPRVAVPTQRVRNRSAVLDLDAQAFSDATAFPGTALDADALTDALRATTRARFRTIGDADAPLGYAITGAAGYRGYVQRLAVHPDARRRGIATALLIDGLRWARRRGARTAVVNTHTDNHAARALYESTGFVAFPVGLVVLERAC